MADSLDDEVDGNFDAFQAMLPAIIETRRGEYAPLRHRQVAGYYADLTGALEAGIRNFADRRFSVQEVSDQIADLGFFSHAINTRLA